AAGALAACTATQTQMLAQYGQDDATIAQGLQGILTPLAAVTGISPSTVATVTGLVTEVQTAAGMVAGAATTAAAQSPVKQIETALNGIVTALAAIPILP